LGAERDHVPRAVVLLVGAGPLVLLDDIAVVLVEREAGRDADLFMRSHHEPVEVQRRLRLHQHGSVLRAREVLSRSLVDLVAVRIGFRRQFDFGARHAQEAERMAVREGLGLARADDVVRNRCDLCRVCGSRPQRTERNESRHRGSNYLTVSARAQSSSTLIRMRDSTRDKKPAWRVGGLSPRGRAVVWR
jgi:hypothetical protein